MNPSASTAETTAAIEIGLPLDLITAEYDATPGQLALAWLLHRSPVIVPIPGTKSIAHLEENVGAADVELSDEAAAKLVEIADRN